MIARTVPCVITQEPRIAKPMSDFRLDEGVPHWLDVADQDTSAVPPAMTSARTSRRTGTSFVAGASPIGSRPCDIRPARARMLGA